MDDCTDILTSHTDERSKILNASNSLTNVIYLNGHKNPFDRQFELALKNKNYPISSTTSSFFAAPSSPLNTPLIPPDSAFTGCSAAVPVGDSTNVIDSSPAIITTAQITNLIIESELCKENEADCVSKDSIVAVENDKGQTTTPPIQTVNDSGKDENANKLRSNMVSVICPPVVPSLIKSSDQKIRSAPVILDTANCANLESKNVKLDNPVFGNHPNLPDLTTKISAIAPKSIADPINLAVSKSDSTSSCEPICFNHFHPTSQPQSSPTKLKIFPKQNSSNSTVVASSLTQPLSSLSPARRKEKTVDELINKIKETEAALPPKAKPGRKSKSATEEDSQEKKRLSLERNRAAAMRCRLKKKKEIDELKRKVESYEKQNQQLQQIIHSLYNQVDYLKSELMRHKDCN